MDVFFVSIKVGLGMIMVLSNVVQKNLRIMNTRVYQ